MMGYSPGFPYLTGMNEKLYVNHTSQKKKSACRFCVIIEGKKCGIVTTDTYNDWLVMAIPQLNYFHQSAISFNLLKLGR